MNRSTAQSPLPDAHKLMYLNSEGADRPLVSPIAEEVLQRARQSVE